MLKKAFAWWTLAAKNMNGIWNIIDSFDEELFAKWPAHNAYVYIRRNSCSSLAMCLKPRNQSAAISLNHTLSSEHTWLLSTLASGWRLGERRGEWGLSEQLALKLNSFNLRISAVNSGLHVSWKGVKWGHAHVSMHVHNSPNIFENTFSSFNSHLPGARCKFLIVMIKVANKTQ